jgi:hypothetical protein
MKNKSQKVYYTIGLTILFIMGSFYPVTIDAIQASTILSSTNTKEIIQPLEIINDNTNYWALLIAVGVYKDTPNMDRPLMLYELDNLYTTLLSSQNWKENNIQVIAGKNATLLNIFQGFKWLDQMEGEGDTCFVYLTTHGFPILADLPPFDENDNMDEALATYNGFLPYNNPWSWEPLANPLGIITDDVINFLLNNLEAKGVCMIVDSCYSGGFNDNWKYDYMDVSSSTIKNQRYVKPGKDNNRIVLTSVGEKDISWGSYFSHFLVEGMKGYSDNNKDGICSVEEIFLYATPFVLRLGLNPQIFDDYPGDLPLIKTG